jgi:hypothetical protein
VDYLFKFTTAHRLEALTDAENIAEQPRLIETSSFALSGGDPDGVIGLPG